MKFKVTTLEDLRKKMCFKKTGYNNSLEIKSFLSRLERQGKFNYSQVNIYECPFCNKHHWGSAKL